MLKIRASVSRDLMLKMQSVMTSAPNYLCSSWANSGNRWFVVISGKKLGILLLLKRVARKNTAYLRPQCSPIISIKAMFEKKVRYGIMMILGMLAVDLLILLHGITVWQQSPTHILKQCMWALCVFHPLLSSNCFWRIWRDFEFLIMM